MIEAFTNQASGTNPTPCKQSLYTLQTKPETLNPKPYTIDLFNCLELYHTQPDFSDRQYKAGTRTIQLDPVRRADGELSLVPGPGEKKQRFLANTITPEPSGVCQTRVVCAKRFSFSPGAPWLWCTHHNP